MCAPCGCQGPVAGSGPLSQSRVSRGIAPPAQAPRRIALARQILERNDLHAVFNRDRFRDAGIQAVNLLSSPGAGKTALLEALAREATGCASQHQAVIVGDLATDNDARRLQAVGLPAVQISTGQGCHLEASQVSAALDQLEAAGHPLAALDLLWIENVGNLVCPAAFDLGESLRVVLLSTTEGEDKPLKYPALFHSADLVLISKIDLAEVVDFDRAAALAALARVSPRARVLECSARTGQGLAEVLQFLIPPPGRPSAAAVQAPHASLPWGEALGGPSRPGS